MVLVLLVVVVVSGAATPSLPPLPMYFQPVGKSVDQLIEDGVVPV
jgi:hypothetical protein